MTSDASVQNAYDTLVQRVCPCVIIGHSQAGQFVYRAAQHAPDKVKAVVLVEPVSALDPAQVDPRRVKHIPHLIVWHHIAERTVARVRKTVGRTRTPSVPRHRRVSTFPQTQQPYGDDGSQQRRRPPGPRLVDQARIREVSARGSLSSDRGYAIQSTRFFSESPMSEKKLTGKIARERIRLMQVPRPPAGMIDEFKSLGDATGIVSDIMDELGIVGALPASRFAPTLAGSSIVGPALTVRNIMQREHSCKRPRTQ
jgi:pimeloyl-ACP methyl ester carboxylesterase